MSKKKIIKRLGLGILGTAAAIVIWLSVPQSPVKIKFNQQLNTELKKTSTIEGVFTKEDIADLPKPLQKYFEYCGYLGKPKMSSVRITYDNVDFKFAPERPALKIKYIQYNFADRPDRMALIDARMYGIPFQGIDKSIEGKGATTGVAAKLFTVFDNKGSEMDKAALVTALGESIFVPSVFLQDFISYETISDTQLKATIDYYGMQASGIFTFNEKGELESFTTEDRYMFDDSGNSKKAKWTAVTAEYKEVNGIKLPNRLQGIWNLPEGDFIYFDSTDMRYDYNIKPTQ